MKNKKIYICKDTITGIFSGIYDAWKQCAKGELCGVALSSFVEQELFCEYYEVEESEKKKKAVEYMIVQNLGLQAYHDIYYAILSSKPDKADAILGTMLEAKNLENSRQIMEHLSNPKVERVFSLSRMVSNEAHSLKEFLRFRELENGVLYAPITPQAKVLLCLAPHFSDRFPLENWMIHDKTHGQFAIHEARRKWVLAEEEELNTLGVVNHERFSKISEKEQVYVQLWKGFVESIAIKERANPKCQMSHLPLKYRPNMTEFIE